MDRQLVNTLHLSQVKVPSASDSLPTTSRQAAKNYARPNNKQVSRNGNTRYQNKQQRGRESKALAQHFRESFDSDRNYLADSRNANLYGKTPLNSHNHGKSVSIKERFVSANCQFVMAPTSDNLDLILNPDFKINWDFVEEVLFTCSNNNEVCCPICLSPPTAAKITRCGHIYCWSCILHFLALSDKESRSCPICYESVQKSELKSVNIVSKIAYTNGNYLTFNLMKIRKNSTVALPVNFNTDEPLNRLKRNVSPILDQFGKFFTASTDTINAIIEREEKELAAQLLEYELENMPEVCFVHSAMDELQKRKLNMERLDLLCQQMAGFSFSTDSPILPLDDFVYFYQSEDGQAIYLHAFNVRMLKHQYGDLKHSPPNITAKIIDLSSESVSPDMRRRYAHFRHLEYGREIKIAECSFDNTVISQSTLDEFGSEICQRKLSRKRKEKAQKARDRKIEIENKRKIYGIVPDPTFHLDNVADFPDYLSGAGNDTTIGIGPEETASSSSEPGLGSSPPLPTAEFHSSFAKMLSAGSGEHEFNNTLRKKPLGSDQSAQYAATAGDGDEADGVAMQPMNITLGDFFDNCIKTSKKGRKNKKK